MTTLADKEMAGFEATAPLGLWNKRVSLDYPGVFKALARSVVALAGGNVTGAVNAAIDGIATFKIQASPPVLAWHLIRLALARAMAELTVESVKGMDVPLGDPAVLVARLDGVLDATLIWINRDLFERPADLPVLAAVREPFGEWLASFGLNSAQIDSVFRRLAAYFTFALHREWAAQPNYAPIEAELREAATPFARAHARERAWLKNAAYLRRLVHEPVFDKTFGLEQVYVPLRAWYYEQAPGRSSGLLGSDAKPGGEKRTKSVVDLQEHMTSWLRAGDRGDPVRMICGGPGSGKTSFAKTWAAALAESHHVLLVPLHRLDFQGDLQRSLADFLADWNVLPDDPLDANVGERQLLILFDGLDELAMQGRAGQEVAREFVEVVYRRVERVNDQNARCIKVVFCGRDVVVQATERMVDDRQILYILPYHGTDVRQFTSGIPLLEDDRYACGRWWVQFGRAIGESYTGIPDALAQEKLTEITAQPLLNYLLALSFRRGRRNFSNLNVVYQDLLSLIYQRKWSSSKHPTAKTLREFEFVALLEELGLAAWQSARTSRIISETELQHACERAGITPQLVAFREGTRSGALSLLAAFYFRHAGEGIFEFTHRSFADYLAARRILRCAATTRIQRALRRSDRQLGWGEDEALKTWVQITGPTALSESLLGFLRREAALHEHEDAAAWREILTELISDQLQHGLPMHHAQLSTYEEMTRQARNSEESLFATHSACAAATNTRSRITWPHRGALSNLLTRLNQGEVQPLSRKCLGWIHAAGQELERANLHGADLEGSDLAT